MKLGPRFHESLLSSGQGACEGLDRIESEDPDIFLIVRVEMGKVVRLSSFCKLRMMIPKNREASGITGFQQSESWLDDAEYTIVP